MLRYRRFFVLVVLALLAASLPVAGASAAPAAQTAACTYRATFLGDVTIPDNAIVRPNQTFVKTWRLRNDGNCAWGPGQTVDSVMLTGGHALGSSTIVSLNSQIAPGKAGLVSVNFTAPGAAGTIT